MGAIMFADMTGFTAMMQEDEPRARLLRERQRSVLEELIPLHHGTIIQYFGDGTLVLFDSVSDAVRSGIAIQKELQKEPKVRLRIGIHCGDVVRDSEGIYGDPVNVASRIESIAVPGSVLFSEKVFDEVKNQPDIIARPIGRFRFKNVRQPMQIFAAVSEGLVIPTTADGRGKIVRGFPARRFFASRKGQLFSVALLALLMTAILVLKPLFAKSSGLNSIAVLPLENLSGDPAQDYFVSGMHETLITELSKISSLRVISRTSMMQYKNSSKPAPQIAKELGVKVLLQGSVIRENDQVRITVQLVDGSSDKHLWSQEFNRELKSILSLYSDVAQQVAAEIRLKLTSADESRLTPPRPVNPRAYEYYLRGRHSWNQRTLPAYEQAIAYYNLALKQDSNYAPAYAALADAYMLSGEQGGIPQRDALRLSENAITKALELDNKLAEAYVSRAVWELSNRWDWNKSEELLKRAIELNPGHAPAYQIYGRILGFIGRHDEALQHLESAKVLDPLSPVILAYMGQIKIFAGRYTEADQQLRDGLKLHPAHPLLLHNVGELYIAWGRADDAIAPLKKSADSSGSFHYRALLALGYARAGQRSAALKTLQAMLGTSEPASPFNLAIVYMGLGDKERALQLVEQGYREHDVWMKELRAWPWFDELRDDPRYQALIEKMNFPR